MGKIRFTDDDLNFGNIVKIPGWYGFEITKVVETQAKKDKSTIWKVSLKVLNCADGADKDMIGSSILKVFSEKGIGYAKTYFEGLGGEVKAGSEFDFNETKGMKIDGYLQRGKNNETGGDTNVVEIFRKYTDK